MEVGGFTEGIYGEDVDFTYAVARIGYRAVIDTRVRSYEDVPNTQRQLRTQRTRWNRGGTMAFAAVRSCRHRPVRTALLVLRHPPGSQEVPRPPAPDGIHLCAGGGRIDAARHSIYFACFSSLRSGPVPSLLEITVCTIYYRKWRELLWLPFQYLFVVLRYYYRLECFLSFNARR